MLWFYTTFDEFTSIWVIAVAQTVLSIGLALSFTPLFTASLGSLQPRFYSYGSAVLGTVQQVAGAAGIALMITIMASVTADAVESGASEAAAGAQGAQAAFLIAAIVSLPLIVGAFLIRKPADQQGPAPARALTRSRRGITAATTPLVSDGPVVTCWARPSLGRGP